MVAGKRAFIFQNDAVFVALHICDPAGQNPRVLAGRGKVPDRRCEVRRGQGRGRDLIKQRFK